MIGGEDERIALARAEAIRSYWANRGYDVTVSVEYVPGYHPRGVDRRDARGLPHWKIITDLVNGFPRRKLRRDAA